MRARLRPLVVAGLLVAAGCSAIQPAAAIVDGRKIPESAVEEEISRVRDDPNFRELVRRQGPTFRGRVRRDVLSQFIRVTFLEVQATKRGIVITDSQIANFVEGLKEQAGGEEAFHALLKESNLGNERLQTLARRQLYQQKLEESLTKNLDVDESKLRAFYDQNAERYREYHLQRITVQRQEDATRIAEQAQQGGNFARLARERSTDSAAQQGGDIGFVAAAQLGALGSQIESLPAGGVAGPVRGSAGFEVYKLVERRVRPLDDVKAEIRERLLVDERRTAFDGWVANGLRRADVTVNPKYGRFDEGSLQVIGPSNQEP